ncbi:MULTISPECIES: diguanylate cyclase [unclassified Modicisalibacter]|uniref:sensor domain-containing diguanylate cyclase n=1 Tax=unclassified Modicisalibacter TaxID=2679913 RepID=UPI001CC9CD4A|nr:MULTISPECIES: diguanylate cyclase [unclassified Modicisalibacter]MBZ9559986.1 diguanylate cyclase [Modicisalibacter sp. R2A 31.J]MBZ9575895.1 diguanylate cyclase [Modicisalibacter sp. MOD 31.J]
MSRLDASLAHAAESLDLLVWHVPTSGQERRLMAGNPRPLLGLSEADFLALPAEADWPGCSEERDPPRRATLMEHARRHGNSEARYSVVVDRDTHWLDEQISYRDGGWYGLIRRLQRPAAMTALPPPLDGLCRQLLDKLPHCAFIARREPTTKRFRYCYANPFLAERFGSESLLGRSPQEAFGDYRGGRLEKRYAACLTYQRPVTYEETLNYPQQRYNIQTTLITLGEPSVAHEFVIGFVHDLTELDSARQTAANAHRRLRHLLDTSPAVLYACDPHTPWSFNYISRNVRRLLGLDDKASSPDTLLERVHPDDRDPLTAWLGNFTHHHQGRRTLRYRLQHADGHYLTLQNQARLSRPRVSNSQPELVGTLLDVSREAELLAQLELMTTRIPGLIFQLHRGAEGGMRFPYLAGNDRILDTLDTEGLRRDAHPVLGRVVSEDRPRLMATLERSAESLAPVSLQLRLHGFDESIRWLLIRAQPERCNGDGTLWHGVLLDVSEQIAREQRLRTLSDTDELTGLANRRRLMKGLEEETSRARRHGSTLSLILLDLDHFKRINDTWGHVAGDQVLERLAQLCRDTLRQEDIIARFGGEELAILLPLTPLDQGLRLAERLRRAVAEHDFCVPRGAVTASLGVAEYRDGESLDTLLERADRGLYDAKRGGRNRVSSDGD